MLVEKLHQACHVPQLLLVWACQGEWLVIFIINWYLVALKYEFPLQPRVHNSNTFYNFVITIRNTAWFFIDGWYCIVGVRWALDLFIVFQFQARRLVINLVWKSYTRVDCHNERISEAFHHECKYTSSILFRLNNYITA